MGVESTQELGPTLEYIAKRLEGITTRVEVMDFGIEKRILDIVDRQIEDAKEDIHRDLEQEYVSQVELDQALDEAGFMDEKGVEGIVTEALDAALQEDGTVEGITEAAVRGAMRVAGERNLWATDEQVKVLQRQIDRMLADQVAVGLWQRLRWLFTGHTIPAKRRG